MRPISLLEGPIAVLPLDDIDTDRIIPARFLSRISRTGYGELLFADSHAEGFPLDQPEASGASILVPGNNFGCGSSREHAVWALQQAGFLAVIGRADSDSPAFSDIFRQNSGNCGLLLVEVDPEPHAAISSLGSGATVAIDLSNQTVSWSGGSAEFPIAPATKAALLAGLDLIGTTLELAPQIEEFESSRAGWLTPRLTV